MPKSATVTPSGRSSLARRRTTSQPKASSVKKMFPTPATSIFCVMSPPLDLVGGEVQETPVLDLQVGVGVVLERDGEEHLVLEVVEDRLHIRHLAGEEHVLGIGSPCSGPEAHL